MTESQAGLDERVVALDGAAKICFGIPEVGTLRGHCEHHARRRQRPVNHVLHAWGREDLMQIPALQQNPRIGGKQPPRPLEMGSRVGELALAHEIDGSGAIPTPDHIVFRWIRPYPVEQQAGEIPVHGAVLDAGLPPIGHHDRRGARGKHGPDCGGWWN